MHSPVTVINRIKKLQDGIFVHTHKKKLLPGEIPENYFAKRGNKNFGIGVYVIWSENLFTSTTGAK